jgi:phenylalanine-4-hydroxylase
MTPTEKTLARLPAHLRRYVVGQEYEAYTPRDQAVWRHILRRLRSLRTCFRSTACRTTTRC